jgi:2'-5' RNA ligase
MSRSENAESRLFLAVVPDPSAAERIHRLAGALKRAHRFSGKLMAPESLHISLFFLGECEDQLVRLACDAASNVRAQPFDVWFDRSATFRGRPGNRPFVLIGDSGLEGVRSLRRSLGAALAKKGMRRLARREFTPHVTLLYAEREVEENPIEAIRWTVSDFVLVHSLRGHRHLARWPLQPCFSKDSSLYDYSSHRQETLDARDSAS